MKVTRRRTEGFVPVVIELVTYKEVEELVSTLRGGPGGQWLYDKLHAIIEADEQT